MYEGDSFYTLNIIERFGLILISITLTIVTAGLFLKIAKRVALPVRLILACFFLWSFTWLSPQIYYFYYTFLIEGLEVKNVIHLPPDFNKIYSLFTFTDRSNLSNHGKGILGWILIILSFWIMRNQSKSLPKKK